MEDLNQVNNEKLIRQLVKNNYNVKIKKFLIIILILLPILYFPLRQIFQTRQPTTQKPQLTTVKVAMGYIPNVQFAPFYLALEKGYFNQESLQIDFDYGWETDIITLLAKNELQIGIGSGEQVILAREKGLPIINFFNWYQRFPVSITSLEKNKIIKPVDLIGKKVGIPVTYGASFIGWQAFLQQNNLPEDKIKLEVIGYTQVASLTEGKVQAAVTYAMNEPVQLKSMGYGLNNFEVADLANFVSNGLLTNEQTIRENPQLVQAFTRAFTKGLQDTINNPDEAFEAAKKFIPEIKDETTQKQVLKESIRFWQTNRLGLNNPEQWQQSADLLEKLNLIKEKPAIDNLYTNQFIL